MCWVSHILGYRLQSLAVPPSFTDCIYVNTYVYLFIFLGPLDEVGLGLVAKDRKQWFSKVRSLLFLLHEMKSRDKKDGAAVGTPGLPNYQDTAPSSSLGVHLLRQDSGHHVPIPTGTIENWGHEVTLPPLKAISWKEHIAMPLALN